MARLLFVVKARRRPGPVADSTYVAYSDAAGTVLADISLTSGGSAIPGSTFTLDALGKAVFWGPPDGSSNLYVRVPADPSLGVQEIKADHDARLDAIEAAGGGAHPNLATHDAMGLATDAELTTHAAAADPHAGYLLESLLDAKGDLYVASAADTPARLAVGTAGQVPAADSAQTSGIAWTTIISAGTAASRPAAASANTGHLYFATDTGVLWRSTGSAWVRVSFDDQALLNGSLAIRAPYSRQLAGTNLAALTSGVMHLVAVPLYAGDVITNIAFCSGTTALTMGSNADGNLWFALYDIGAANLLSQTAAQGGAATWAANSVKSLALGAAQTITTTGIYYIGIMVNAGTGGSPAVPSLRGQASGTSTLTGVFVTGMKQLSGTNGTGLGATAPAGPLTIANNANIPYCVGY